MTETDTLAGKATLRSGLLLRRSEVMRSLRYYQRAQSQGHHTINHPDKRGVERGSARQSSLKGRDEHQNRFKCHIGETSERQGGAHNYGLFWVHKYHLELN